eukprot:CAMPEP_0114290514 /NCGR_PEP_ID=MMETSP0059-20121206/7976_1 /TAXON_ID=36894 /ORGANISM="Pyramimonas parkeae, Strain CCMP726" /LENGTH=53 /DNA_ID=CAMNT_0001411915 /DNA_START=387 /DNA_END=545 /DNA_ORIENTATION=-
MSGNGVACVAQREASAVTTVDTQPEPVAPGPAEHKPEPAKGRASQFAHLQAYS